MNTLYKKSCKKYIGIHILFNAKEKICLIFEGKKKAINVITL